jgi:hypothetical protein
VQSAFIDNPSVAVGEADMLVIEVMRERGYPIDDFDQQAADISVDHPTVVENYRAAHGISVSQRRAMSAQRSSVKRSFTTARCSRRCSRRITTTTSHQRRGDEYQCQRLAFPRKIFQRPSTVDHRSSRSLELPEALII